MPAWTGKLADDDILKIGAYLHSLRGTAIDNPLPGNVAHGEEVFWGKGQCGSCHMLNGKGALKGPDLANIAAEPQDPIPDRRCADQAACTRLSAMAARICARCRRWTPMTRSMSRSSNGKAMDGVLLNQDSYSVQMMGDDNQLHLLDRAKSSVSEQARADADRL